MRNVSFLLIVSLLLSVACNLEEIPSTSAPRASFRVNNGGCLAPCDPGFVNQSQNATSYEWAFGDGSTSTLATPTHSYAAAGTYNVTLKARNTAGAEDDTALQVIILSPAPAPVANFSVSGGGCFAPCEVNFTNSSTNASSYTWDFGDGTATSAEASPAHTFQIGGGYTVTLTATGPGGTNIKTLPVTINSIKFRKDDTNVSYTTIEVRDDGYLVGGASGLGLSATVATWKFNKLGQQTDIQTYPTFVQFPFVRTITANVANNGYLIGGSFGSGTYYDDPFCLQLDASLVQTWGKEYAFEPCSGIYDIAKAPDGYMLAGFQGDCDQGTYTALLVKTDLNGNISFSKLLSGIDNVPAIERLSDGYVIAYGGGYAKIDFGGNVVQTFSLPSGSTNSILTVSDGFIITGGGYIHKLNSSLAVTKSALVPAVGGTFTMTGGEIATQAQDGGYGVVMVKNNQLKLVKLNATFDFVWEKNFNGTFNSGGTQSHYVIKAVPDGGFAIVGYGTGFFLKTDPLGNVE